MDWAGQMNAAIRHIEEHLTDPLRTADIARVAGCSPYHFQRMFAYMTGVPLSAYIRRRRMTLAVADLRHGMKIIDVASKYCYQSPTAFNRAFQGVHGTAPSLAKAEGVPLKSYPPLDIAIEVRGVEGLDVRIETRRAFRILGVSAPLYGDFAGMAQPVEQAWARAEQDGSLQQMQRLAAGGPARLLEVMLPDEHTESWRYWIAAPSDARGEEGLEAYTVGAYTWAIFAYAGKSVEETHDLGERIIAEWLPASGYEYDNGPDIAVHAAENGGQAILEYWLPIKKP